MQTEPNDDAAQTGSISAEKTELPHITPIVLAARVGKQIGDGSGTVNRVALGVWRKSS
jgi:hypothetical protein